ncbi:hypothetical protein WR25_18318 isoform B [Diploscapter pachys]|nr:hypothetical protein WR25_18318 isoform B [Diploscapter pachys]
MPGVHTFYDGCQILQPFADAIGIEIDRTNFVVAMFINLCFAYIYRTRMGPGQVSRQVRTVAPSILGIALCFFCFGRAIKHLLSNALISYVIMYFAPAKHVHKLVFLFAMGYLLFIHFYRFLILTSYYLDITGPIMVAVEKITMIAFNLHDGVVKKESELTPWQKRQQLKKLPSFLEYMSYIFNFQTVLTGPVNFYSDYEKFLDGTHVPLDKSGKPHSPTKVATKKCIEALVYMIIIATLGSTYTPELITRSDYLALPIYKWLFWWFFTIQLIRVTYYFAWVLADAICNLSGFGFNGFDEQGNPQWTLCTSVYPYKVEMAQSFKETLDGWNTLTGEWLRQIAYERAPKNIRTLSTYVLSAVWHGVSVGYYMTFMTGALMTLAGSTFRRCMRWRFVDNPQAKLVYDFVSFWATKVALAYTTYPFVMMNLQPGLFVYQ